MTDTVGLFLPAISSNIQYCVADWIYYNYYRNHVTRTVSKPTATFLACYHINITLTQSHVPSVNTQLHFGH